MDFAEVPLDVFKKSPMQSFWKASLLACQALISSRLLRKTQRFGSETRKLDSPNVSDFGDPLLRMFVLDHTTSLELCTQENHGKLSFFYRL